MFPLTLKFSMKAEVNEGESDSGYVGLLKRNTGIDGAPKWLISQVMTNYNHFLTESQFHFALYPYQSNQTLVEMIGWVGLAESVPELRATQNGQRLH